MLFVMRPRQRGDGKRAGGCSMYGKREREDGGGKGYVGV